MRTLKRAHRCCRIGFNDEARERLRRKMLELSGSDGRNLATASSDSAMRAYSYRGGREAWEVARLPETEVVTA